MQKRLLRKHGRKQFHNIPLLKEKGNMVNMFFAPSRIHTMYFGEKHWFGNKYISSEENSTGYHPARYITCCMKGGMFDKA